MDGAQVVCLHYGGQTTIIDKAAGDLSVRFLFSWKKRKLEAFHSVRMSLSMLPQEQGN